MQKTLLVVGAVLVLTGLLWPWLSSLGIGRLPGDIMIERDGFRFYFPITTCVVVSLVIAAIFWLLR